MQTERKTSNNGTEVNDDRLMNLFEIWATSDASIAIHPSVRIVNNNNENEKSMGCQIRATNGNIKKGEVLMTVPRHAMITPDLVAASDAGRAILACCKQRQEEVGTTDKSISAATTKSSSPSSSSSSFWDAFENTVICEQKFLQQIGRDSGTQLSCRILQERNRAETVYKENENQTQTLNLSEPGIISTRAVFLAFLIQQRFHPNSRQPIVSEPPSSDFDNNLPDNCALQYLKTHNNSIIILNDAATPKTFGPYAHILPPSISLPICWNQHQLSLLDTVTGYSLLQEVCCSTMQLTTEFMALIEAGILWRFPQIFPKGLLTWERWLWAASCFTSRILPMECYFNNRNRNNSEGDVKCSTSDDEPEMPLLQSPREIWAELGVMIPVLDMLNSDIELQSVKWESPTMTDKASTYNESCVREEDKEKKDEAIVVSSESDRHPRAIMEKDIQNGQQIFTCYGNELSNRLLILQYGFAQVENVSDELSIGWGLMDAVGNVEKMPSAATTCYSSLLIDNNNNDNDNDNDNDRRGNDESANFVYDSTKQEAIMKWWSEDRLKLLERALPNVDKSFISSLKSGEKMMSTAHAEDATYDPCLLTTAVYGTMPVSDVHSYIKRCEAHNDSHSQLPPMSISKRHQYILRNYLLFFFSRKLEKMLHHLSQKLNAFVPKSARLWLKASEGGLRYQKKDRTSDSVEIEHANDASKRFMGWEALFEENATMMKGEKTSYTVDPTSCVFALYDGHLKALQSSVDDLLTLEKFNDSVLTHLVQLGFVVESEDKAMLEVKHKAKTVHTGVIANDSIEEHPTPSKRSRLN